MLGPLGDSQIAGKHPSGVDRQSCRANPLGQPSRARAGSTFCDPRTSCGCLYVLRIRWQLLEYATVGHTVGHRCVLTLPVMLQNWLKCLHRDECWSRRGAPIPSPAPVFGLERELSTLFSMICKRITRLRTEKPPTGAVRAGFPTIVAWSDRV